VPLLCGFFTIVAGLYCFTLGALDLAHFGLDSRIRY